MNKKQKVKLEEDGYLIPEVADFPRNRWQAFKEKYFPYFLKRLIPVKYEKVKVRENLLKMAIEKSIIKKGVHNVQQTKGASQGYVRG